MKLGAEPKKIAVLSVLSAAAGYFIYANLLSAPAPYPQASPAKRPGVKADAVISQVAPKTAAPSAARRGERTRTTTEEFRPSLKPKRGEEAADPMSIDPTLRLDLLAKVQSVDAAGGARNLFQFSTPPPPPASKTPDPKIIPKTPAQIAQEQAKQNADPAKAPPPPIALKFFGYSAQNPAGRKRAFLLDGEDIIVAEEGETVKKRYKLIRIQNNSVLMEDLDHKHQQTLPIQPETG